MMFCSNQPKTRKAERGVGGGGLVPASAFWGTKKILDICKSHKLTFSVTFREPPWLLKQCGINTSGQ